MVTAEERPFRGWPASSCTRSGQRYYVILDARRRESAGDRSGRQGAWLWYIQSIRALVLEWGCSSRSPWHHRLNSRGGFNLKSPWERIKTCDLNPPQNEASWKQIETVCVWFPTWVTNLVTELNASRYALFADGIAVWDPVPNSTHLQRPKLEWGRLDRPHQERCPQFWGDVDGAQKCAPCAQVSMLKNERFSTFYKTNNFWPKVVEWNCSPTISRRLIIKSKIRRDIYCLILNAAL